MLHPLLKLVELQKQHQAIGIYSACTANELVLQACMERAKETNSVLLIESTSNQVDQYGGYTGMKPQDFIHFVEKLANQTNLPMEQIILGGDHLGPLTFTNLAEDKAMAEASELVRQYVLAGYTKIHIDTSMKVFNDDPNTRLTDEIIAHRGAMLVKVAEEAFAELVKTKPDATHPIYIVGSEVPIPGGSQSAVEDSLEVTKVIDFKKTVATFKQAFVDQNITEAFKYVIAVVVQPGIEEKDSGCVEYDREKAHDLTQAINEYPNLIFEGHSTDYQTKIKLKELVEDGIGILKVGPGLTFAMREGLFALASIEEELFKNTNVQTSHFKEVLEKAMLENPKYWQKHYHGDKKALALKRKYSFSDRARYYMPLKEVQAAQALLFKNLANGVPLNLLSQYMPIQYTLVREKHLVNKPEELVKSRIKNTIDEYLYATNQQLIK